MKVMMAAVVCYESSSCDRATLADQDVSDVGEISSIPSSMSDTERLSF